MIREIPEKKLGRKINVNIGAATAFVLKKRNFERSMGMLCGHLKETSFCNNYTAP